MMPGLWSIPRQLHNIGHHLARGCPLFARLHDAGEKTTNKIRGWMHAHLLITEFGVVFAERTGVKPADDPGN